MQQLSTDFKMNVSAGLLLAKQEQGYADTKFFHTYGINRDTCAKLLEGCIDVRMQDAEWLRLARKLNIVKRERQWQTARTEVFTTIEEDILFCKAHAKAKIYVDDCGIGKTYTAKYLAKTLPNCFYVDASQGKTLMQFTEVLAKAIGLNAYGKNADIKEDIKCYLNMIEKPIVIIDEAGDLRQSILQDIKEFWNATENNCGWYLIGAEGLKHIMELGMRRKRPGFKEIFSRFSDKYTSTVPIGKDDKIAFYKKLITDVLSANMNDDAMLKDIVKKCLIMDTTGHISGLRRAESLLILHNEN